MSNSATPERTISNDQAWSLEKRILSLRNCAYLMICTGNEWSGVNPLKVIASHGLVDHVSIKRFKQIWDGQKDRFDREQLTKIPPADIPGEGK